MKVLFITPVPLEGAGTRARIAQYLELLKAEGIEGDIHPFLFTDFFQIAYAPGRWGTKLRYFLLSSARRLADCLRAKQYDVIYLYRECLPFGPPIGEWLLLLSGRPIVYDFDDAIHLPDPRTGWARRLIEKMKWHSKVAWIIKHSTHIVVGNRYLQAYASRLNPHVTVLPTPEEPSRFNSGNDQKATPMTIGWIGTHSTAQYLRRLAPVFQALAERYSFELRVIGAGVPIAMPGVRIRNEAWQLDREAHDVQSFDIGVYPLSETEFDRGKACYKAILYMAAGVPVVASNYGANQDIIQDGVNGFLASSEREWTDRLARLFEDPQLRARLAQQGRQTVLRRYTVAVNAPTLVGVLKTVQGKGAGRRK